MSNREETLIYSCYDDCVQAGCPKHEAKLTLQTTSMAYHFTAHNIDWYFDPREFEVLAKLMKAIDYGSINKPLEV